MEPHRRPHRILSLVVLPLVVVALAVPVIVWRRELWDLFSSRSRLQEWIAAAGLWAPLAFVGVQTLQVIVFFIPGEVPQIAGGYLFGPWLGTLLSLCGILLGSAIDFWIGRLAGLPFVHAVFPPAQVERARRLLDSPRSKVAFFLLFLIPAIPKDVLCYVAGLSPIRFPFFAAVSALGRLPALVGSTVMGAAAAERNWWLAGGLAALAVVLFATGWLLRGRIESWIARIASRRKSRRHRGGATPSSPRPRTARRTPRPASAARRSGRR